MVRHRIDSGGASVDRRVLAQSAQRELAELRQALDVAQTANRETRRQCDDRQRLQPRRDRQPSEQRRSVTLVRGVDTQVQQVAREGDKSAQHARQPNRHARAVPVPRSIELNAAHQIAAGSIGQRIKQQRQTVARHADVAVQRALSGQAPGSTDEAKGPGIVGVASAFVAQLARECVDGRGHGQAAAAVQTADREPFEPSGRH